MRRLLGACGIVACCALAPTPIASAAIYDVDVCTAAGHDGITVGDPTLAAQITVAYGCGDPAKARISQQTTVMGTVAGDAFWTLDAPPGTTIATVDADRNFAGTWAAFPPVRWRVVASGQTLDAMDTGTVPPAPSRVTYTVNSTQLTTELLCLRDPCQANIFGVALGNVVAHFDDPTPPLVTALGGSLLGGGPLSGTKELTFSATDQGSGIAQADLVVDAVKVGSVSDTNQDRCVKPYKFVVPCRTSISSALPFDTASVPNGDRQVRLALTDAAGQKKLSAPVTVTVQNPPPTLTSDPVVTGNAKIGERLFVSTGDWDGSPFTYRYQWLRCTPDVTVPANALTCTPIAGATGATYVLARDDVFQRVIAEVTAISGGGSTPTVTEPLGPVADELGRTSSPTGGPGGDTTPPVLSGASLSTTRLRGAKAATTLRLTSSEGGRLTILIERARPGQKIRKGGKLVCKAVRRPIRRGRCTAYARAGTLTRTIAAARASVTLNSRIGTKRLAPGSYRLTITVRDAAGNVSNAKRLSLAILR